MKKNVLISALLLLIFCGSSRLWANSPTTGTNPGDSLAIDQAGKPLAELLNPDGSFNLSANYQGSIDLAGYDVQLTANGPQFTPLSGENDKWSSTGQYPGANSSISDAIWTGSSLYVAGGFTIAGTKANYIAMWDPATGTWSTLGSGLNGSANALAWDGTNLYVGGQFTTAGGVTVNRVARWTPATSTWSALGNGTVGVNGLVNALVWTGSELYVGGSFTSAGNNVIANRVVKFNPLSFGWTPLGSGAGNGVNNTVRALSWTGSELYVAGDFTTAGGNTASRMAMWNPTNFSWSALGSGVSFMVTELAWDGSLLYAAGSFNTAGGSPVNRIAKWDPVNSFWSSLDIGVSSIVHELVWHNNKLYVGGQFTTAGGFTANGLATWDPANNTWEAVDEATNFGTVFSIAIAGSDMYLGGTFSGSSLQNNIQKWDGTSLTSLGVGLNKWVRSMVWDGNSFYLGGDFTSLGSISASRIVKWNPSTNSWSALGEGVNGSVYALAWDGASLYVGGSFNAAGGNPASRVTKWDPVTSTWLALGDGVNNIVRSLAVTGNTLYAGGFFTTAGGNAANRIAKWDATNSTWSALGDGLNSDVFTLLLAGSDLYVAGSFTSAGGNAASRIAKWDTNTSTWSALGSGLNAQAYAMTWDGSNLYAAGIFTFAGGNSVNRVAKWEPGTGTWSALATGLNNTVEGLAWSGGNLFATGNFTAASGNQAIRIAKWDSATSTWSAMGDGLDASGYTLAIQNNTLYVGGDFTLAGGKTSPYLASYSPAGPPPANTAPTVESPIQDVTVSYGSENSTFSLFGNFADAESADTELTYTVSNNTNTNVVTAAAINSADGNLMLDFGIVGTATLTVQASDGSLSVTDEFTVTVNKATPVITFSNSATVGINAGDNASTLTLSATSNTDGTNTNPIVFSLLSGPATLSGNVLTFGNNFGVVQVRATQAGSDYYNEGIATQNITVRRPRIIVTDLEFYAFEAADYGSKTYTVSGEDLIGDVNVTAPADMAISTDNSNFSTQLTLPRATGTNDLVGEPVTIYARFTANPTPPFFGSRQIEHTSLNAPTVNSAVEIALCQSATDVCAYAVTVNSDRILLRWLDKAGSGAESYQVERATEDVEGSYQLIHTEPANGGVSYSFTDTELTPGTTYFYRVRWVKN